MFEHEEDTWRQEVHAMSETERDLAKDYPWRAPLGIGGEREDARYE